MGKVHTVSDDIYTSGLEGKFYYEPGDKGTIIRFNPLFIVYGDYTRAYVDIFDEHGNTLDDTVPNPLSKYLRWKRMPDDWKPTQSSTQSPD